MRRVTFLVPKPFLFDNLTVEQQAVINENFSAYVIEPPGTRDKMGLSICDAIVHDDFDPDADLQAAGINWQIIGHWSWDGKGPVNEHVPINEAKYKERIKPEPLLDVMGVQIGEKPVVMRETHRFAGWPELF